MEEDILTDVKKSGQELQEDEAFLETLEENEEEKETPSESSTDNNEDGDKPSQEGDKSDDKPKEGEEADNTPTEDKPEPFHKHPRWKQVTEENQDLRARLEALEQVETPAPSQQDESLPRWWVDLAGDDDVSKNAYKGFQAQTKQDRDDIRKELVQEQQSVVDKQASEQTRWEQWVDLEVQNLKDEGETFDKNELMKVAVDMQPTDENGNISLRKSLQILRLQKAEKSGEEKKKQTERKKLASDTVSGGSGEETPSTDVDSSMLRGKSFTALVQPKNK